MNAAGRKQIKTLIEMIEQAKDQLSDELTSNLASLQDEEREKYDAMPDNLQQSERGEKIEAAADALDEAASYVDQAIEALGNAIDHLNTASE